MSDFEHTSLQDELEVRVIALLTGELSDAEADQLEKILANDAELSAYRDRMAGLMGQLHQASDELADPKEGPRQLSEERRARIFGDPGILDAKAKRKRVWRSPAFWGVAASIAVVFVFGIFSTIKFQSAVLREEHVFEAMPATPPPQNEPEYTVNLQQRNRSTPPPRRPDITVKNPSDTDIPSLDIDVNVDTSSVYGRGGGGFAEGLSAIREMRAVEVFDESGAAAGRDKSGSADFAIDQVETEWLFDFDSTIPVEIPKERIEGTPQPIRVPNLEPAPTEAPRMVVAGEPLAAPVLNAPQSAQPQVPESKPVTERISGERKMGIAYTDFGYAAEGLEEAKSNVDSFAARRAPTKPASRLEAKEQEFAADVSAASGPVDPFAAPAPSRSRQNLKQSKAGSLGVKGDDADALDSISNQPVLGSGLAGNQKIELGGLAENGRRHFLNGDYDAANEAFDDLLEADPNNAGAKLFANRIDSIQGGEGQVKSRKEMLRQVDQAWARPKVFDIESDERVSADLPAAGLHEKTAQIVIPQVNFSGMPLSKVVKTLEELSVVYDPKKEGVALEFKPEEGHDPKVNISLRNLNLDRILQFVTQQVNYSYEVGGNTISIQRSSNLGAVSNYKTELLPISRSVLHRLIASSQGDAASEPLDPFAPQGESIPNEETKALQGFFQSAGVNYELPGSSLAFDGEHLIITQTPRNIERIRRILANYEDEQKAEEAAQNVRLTPKPEKLAAEEPFSTFSLNISDVSFKLAQAALANSRVPPTSQIRTEEFINSFDYNDPSPRADEPVALHWEMAQHPFEHDRQVVRFSLQTQASGRASGQPLNLSLLVDNSGSMQRPDRQAILKNSLQTLEEKLTDQDKLNIVLFARQPRLIAEARTRASQKAAVQSALAYRPEGGTNLEAGLKAAYESNRRNFVPSGSNRVILMTDGAANLGNINAGELADYVVEQRKQGIALDAYGIGWDDYNDALLEEITRNGDGRYAFLNSVEDASEDFSEKLAGTLRVAAANVKVQIEWNPDRVQRYRQIGYDLHQLKKEDFRDNTVDAAEIGEAESGTALYVLKINDDPEIIGGLGTLHVRYLDPASGRYRELSWPLPMPRKVPAARAASPSMRLAMSSAFFGERLSGSPYASGYNFHDLYTMTAGLPEAFPNQPRVPQMQSMLLQASELYGETK